MLARRLILATTALAAFTGAAAAQNWELPPTFGSATLPTGQPLVVELVAGGPIDASTAIGMGCVGGIADAPDYRIQYTADGVPLTFTIDAPSGDTTLAVNDPQGTWFCADDTLTSLDPELTIGAPVAGQYDIWVGVFGPQTLSATLTINSAGTVTGGFVPVTPTSPVTPATPAVDYYVADNGVQAGPLSLEAVIAMIAAGQFDETELAWHAGLAGWVPAGTLPELDAAFNPPPPPPSGPPPLPSSGPPPLPASGPPPVPAAAGAAGTTPPPSGMTLQQVITIGFNAVYQGTLPQPTIDSLVACYIAAFAPLTPAEQQLVADYQIDPPQAVIDQLEAAHPGLTASVEACDSKVPG